MNNLAATIKDRVSMTDIFRQYGFEPNRRGFIACPFHHEKTPSLGTYQNDRRWKCFGCGESGDAITFVMRLYNLSFPQAIIRLDNDFRLGLTGQPSKRQEPKIDPVRAKEELDRILYRAEYMRNTLEFRRLWEALQKKAPTSQGDPLDPEFVLALHRLPYLNYWFSVNPWR